MPALRQLYQLAGLAIGQHLGEETLGLSDQSLERSRPVRSDLVAKSVGCGFKEIRPEGRLSPFDHRALGPFFSYSLLSTTPASMFG